MKHQIKLTINGDVHELAVEPWQTLLDVLRGDLKYSKTKEGCGVGECSSCTVSMDRRTVNSCMVLAVDADGREITTIEGLVRENELHPIQKAFVEQGAIQCGFCTPGMIMSAKALLDRDPGPTDLEIKSALEGNLCRCTGYVKIVEAVKASAKILGAK